MNKTISINPDLFTFSSNKRTSRKKDPSKNNSEIKIKNPDKLKNAHKKIRKQHILRFLRDKQEENYKKLLNNGSEKIQKPIDTTFNSDFEESVKYFNDLSKKNDNKHNYTVKAYNENNSNVFNDIQPLSDSTFNHSLESSQPIQLSEPNIRNSTLPSWGCLKNGNLPTFRDWKRSTQKDYEAIDNDHMQEKKNEIKAMMLAKNNSNSDSKLKYIKQKKTIRRKYKVGRSSNISKVAVLVSNKTIRNNIMNKTQEIKQIPIEEVKKYLVKRGFIRVGTSAPNDVLRKMYESANMICGEIENHNADNLLFNYLNDIE